MKLLLAGVVFRARASSALSKGRPEFERCMAPATVRESSSVWTGYGRPCESAYVAPLLDYRSSRTFGPKFQLAEFNSETTVCQPTEKAFRWRGSRHRLAIQHLVEVKEHVIRMDHASPLTLLPAWTIGHRAPPDRKFQPTEYNSEMMSASSSDRRFSGGIQMAGPPPEHIEKPRKEGLGLGRPSPMRGEGGP